MKLILDMPYDFYDYIDQKDVFFLAQHYQEYKDTELLKRLQLKNIFLDNGAWINDGGVAMEAEEYSKVIDELNPKYAVVPDELGNKNNTKILVKKFQEQHEFKNDITYILPLQGRSVQDYIDMIVWYVHHVTKDIERFKFGLSKGTIGMMLPNRITTTRKLLERFTELDKTTSIHFHFFGYRYGELPFGESHSIDTKMPLKMCLEHYEYENYYSILWKNLTNTTREQLSYYAEQFKESINAD